MLARAAFSARSALRAPALLKRGLTTSAPALDTLLFVEHRAGAVNRASLAAVTAAQKLGGEVHGIIVGSPSEAENAAKEAAQ